MANLTITLTGLALATAGAWMTFGAGWACLGLGLVLFVAGSLGSAQSERRGRV